MRLFPAIQQPPATPPAPADPDSAKWFRSKSDSRQHAVFAEARGGYWFYCGRFAKYARALPKPDDEARRECHGCKSRMRHTYLIPGWLLKVKAEEKPK